MLELFYTLWLAAVKAGDKVWAYIYSGKVHKFFEFKKWEDYIQKIANSCEDFLLIDSKNKNTDFLSLHIKNLEKLKIKNSLLCICTDTLEIETKILRWLNAKNQILYCNIFDSFENNLWDSQLLVHLKDWKWLISNSYGSQKLKRSYRTLRSEKIRTLSKKLLSSHIDYLQFDDTTHIHIHFLKYFQQWQK